MSNAQLAREAGVASVDRGGQSYVEWTAIIAGAVVAAAISTIMAAFGAALGLSAASPIGGSGLSGPAWAIATSLWVLWIAVSSFVAGGYLTGRMRRRIYDASEHESDVRDGSHGLIVWALGALLIAYLATSSALGIAKGAAGAAASTAGAAASLGADASHVALANMADSISGKLFRSTNASSDTPDSVKKDASGLLANGVAGGSMSDEDKAYLTSQVAARTGIAPAEASKRLDDAMAQMSAAADKAKQTAESARKGGILVAFLTAASLAISAAAAWWAATMGGKHRDEGIDLSHLTAWR
jgi:hypothetical protein